MGKLYQFYQHFSQKEKKAWNHLPFAKFCKEKYIFLFFFSFICFFFFSCFLNLNHQQSTKNLKEAAAQKKQQWHCLLPCAGTGAKSFSLPSLYMKKSDLSCLSHVGAVNIGKDLSGLDQLLSFLDLLESAGDFPEDRQNLQKNIL